MDDLLHRAIATNDIPAIYDLVSRGASVNNLYGMKGTPLCAAIAAQKPDVVKVLLERNCDVNAKDYDGEPPLCLAIRKGFTNIAKDLITNQNCNLNKLDPVTLRPPLCIAVIEGHIDVMKWLINNGCNVNQSDNDGNLAMHYAITDGKLDMIELLYQHGSLLTKCNGYGYNVLHHSIYRQEEEIVSFLLTCSSKSRKIVDEQTLIHHDSCLHIAVALESLVLVTMLLKHQTDINITNVLGQTPLYAAVNKNAMEISTTLLTAGSNPDIEADKHTQKTCGDQKRKFSTVHTAIQNGNFDLVKLLINHGASVNIIDCNGVSPLHLALDYNKAEIARYLLAHTTANALTENYNGEDALFAASSCSDAPWFIKTLLSRGCSLNKRNTMDMTPLHKAVEYNCTGVADILLDFGADPDACGEQATTSLHTCALEGNCDMARLLLFYGANINAVNRDGETPLSYAFGSENFDMVALLIRCGADVRQLESILEFDSVDEYLEENVSEEWLPEITNLMHGSMTTWPKLTNICRQTIRQHFRLEGIDLKSMLVLPLPKSLVDFLAFRRSQIGM